MIAKQLKKRYGDRQMQKERAKKGEREMADKKRTNFTCKEKKKGLYQEQRTPSFATFATWYF